VTETRSREIVDGLAEAAPTEADRKDSQIMVDALRAHRDSASGTAAVPLSDPKLDAQVLGEARTRSQEIRQAAAKRVERPIPWWLWLAWIAAIALFIAGWMWLK